MVQTFLPFDSFIDSLSCLDNARCGKQRVEAYQLIDALITGTRWEKHPACKMWKDNVNALIYYYNLSLTEWEDRGFSNNMERYPYQPDSDGTLPEIADDGTPEITYPWWFGWEHFHMSHRASLLRKHPMFYRDKFETPEYYQSRGYLWCSHWTPEALTLTDPVDIDKLFAPINSDTMKSASQSARRLYTVEQLKQMCREKGIRGYSGKKKDELFSLLGIDIDAMI